MMGIDTEALQLIVYLVLQGEWKSAVFVVVASGGNDVKHGTSAPFLQGIEMGLKFLCSSERACYLPFGNFLQPSPN
ncbi:MAG: hypothetical protein HY706_16480 [Candidatus Hydrogenedentes bacterium]|nr:hypothetical protein [Candidatus Hydrogenedentota bacterium]